jgi:predicted AAA+ superfamily ATPase
VKYIKLFEDFKVNNITIDDIIEVIKYNGKIFVSNIDDYKIEKEDESYTAVDVYDDGTIYLDINSNTYQTRLEWVTRIEW